MPTDPAMITLPGNLCAGSRANGSGLGVPSLPAAMTIDHAGVHRPLHCAEKRCAPGLDPPRERLTTLAPGNRAASMPAAIAASKKEHPSFAGAGARLIRTFADDRRIERDTHCVPIVAGRRRDCADSSAVTASSLTPRVADDVAAGRIDAPGEFRETRIDAAVDDPDLHALAGRAGIIRS